jgi:quinol monooxygenase YgiN
MPDHPILTAVKAQVKDPQKPFTMMVYILVRGEKAIDFETAFTPCIQATRLEEGCIAYDLNRSGVDPCRYLNYERWSSVAALDAHLQAPHTVKLLSTIASYLASEPQIDVFQFAGE